MAHRTQGPPGRCASCQNAKAGNGAQDECPPTSYARNGPTSGWSHIFAGFHGGLSPPSSGLQTSRLLKMLPQSANRRPGYEGSRQPAESTLAFLAATLVFLRPESRTPYAHEQLDGNERVGPKRSSMPMRAPAITMHLAWHQCFPSFRDQFEQRCPRQRADCEADPAVAVPQMPVRRNEGGGEDPRNARHEASNENRCHHVHAKRPPSLSDSVRPGGSAMLRLVRAAVGMPARAREAGRRAPLGRTAAGRFPGSKKRRRYNPLGPCAA